MKLYQFPARIRIKADSQQEALEFFQLISGAINTLVMPEGPVSQVVIEIMEAKPNGV